MHLYFRCPSPLPTKRETRKRIHTMDLLYILCVEFCTHYESDFKFLFIVVMFWYWCNFLTVFQNMCVRVFQSFYICHCCNDIVLIKHLLCVYPLCGVCTFLFNFLQGLFMIVLLLFSILIGRLYVSRVCSIIVSMRLYECICKCHHGYCFVVTFVKYASKKKYNNNNDNDTCTHTKKSIICSREWE